MGGMGGDKEADGAAPATSGNREVHSEAHQTCILPSSAACLVGRAAPALRNQNQHSCQALCRTQHAQHDGKQLQGHTLWVQAIRDHLRVDGAIGQQEARAAVCSTASTDQGHQGGGE